MDARKDAMTDQFQDGPLDGVFLDKSYAEAMDLVHEAARYLEGEGKAARDALPDPLRAVFTGESLRMTTRLMQAVAWLMTQRAAANGEITAAEALDPAQRLSGREICLAPPLSGSEDLPERLREMLQESRRIYERIARIEERMLAAAPAENPVHEMLNRIDGA